MNTTYPPELLHISSISISHILQNCFTYLPESLQISSRITHISSRIASDILQNQLSTFLGLLLYLGCWFSVLRLPYDSRVEIWQRKIESFNFNIIHWIMLRSSLAWAHHKHAIGCVYMGGQVWAICACAVSPGQDIWASIYGRDIRVAIHDEDILTQTASLGRVTRTAGRLSPAAVMWAAAWPVGDTFTSIKCQARDTPAASGEPVSEDSEGPVGDSRRAGIGLACHTTIGPAWDTRRVGPGGVITNHVLHLFSFPQ